MVEEHTQQADPIAFQRGMALVRRRRKYFFATIIGYMPLMWLANKISPTFRSMAIAFGIWVVILLSPLCYRPLPAAPLRKLPFTCTACR